MINLSVIVDSDRVVTLSDTKAGIEGENEITQITVTVPAAYQSFAKYIKFQTSQGVYVSSPLLGQQNETTFAYNLPYEVLKAGSLNCTVSCESAVDDVTTIWKSEIFRLIVKKGVLADEEIENYSSTELQDHEKRLRALEAFPWVEPITSPEIDVLFA